MGSARYPRDFQGFPSETRTEFGGPGGIRTRDLPVPRAMPCEPDVLRPHRWAYQAELPAQRAVTSEAACPLIAVTPVRISNSSDQWIDAMHAIGEVSDQTSPFFTKNIRCDLLDAGSVEPATDSVADNGFKIRRLDLLAVIAGDPWSDGRHVTHDRDVDLAGRDVVTILPHAWRHKAQDCLPRVSGPMVVVTNERRFVA